MSTPPPEIVRAIAELLEVFPTFERDTQEQCLAHLAAQADHERTQPGEGPKIAALYDGISDELRKLMTPQASPPTS